MGKEEDVDAMNGGWNLQDNWFIPVMSRMDAAPDCFLRSTAYLKL